MAIPNNLTPKQLHRFNKWAADRRAWFAANPNRETQLVALTHDDEPMLCLSGIVDAFEHVPPVRPGSTVAIQLVGKQDAIVRRAKDSEHGFRVILITRRHAPQDEEKMLGIWDTTRLAHLVGMSLSDFLDTDFVRHAIAGGAEPPFGVFH